VRELFHCRKVREMVYKSMSRIIGYSIFRLKLVGVVPDFFATSPFFLFVAFIAAVTRVFLAKNAESQCL